MYTPFTVTLWAAIKQVQKSAMETGVSFKDYGKFHWIPRIILYMCIPGKLSACLSYIVLSARTGHDVMYGP